MYMCVKHTNMYNVLYMHCSIQSLNMRKHIFLLEVCLLGLLLPSFIGAWRCDSCLAGIERVFQVFPHAKWHVESAIGLVDFAFLMDETYKIITTAQNSLKVA